MLEALQKLKEGIRILSGQLANVEFSYRDPVKNFDRSSVKGVVARLVTIKDRCTMTALEVGSISFQMQPLMLLLTSIANQKLVYAIMQVAAGGKLFNVVVDTESTGKQLLQNGNLRRRVTIIPLNKIQSHIVPTRIQQSAASLVRKLK